MRLRHLVRDHDLPLLAAGAALYAVVATIPLLLVATRLAALVAGPALEQRTLQASTLLPGAGGAALRWLTRRGSAQSWQASAACLLPSGLYGEGLVRSFRRLVPEATPRPALRSRAAALVLVPVTSAVLLVASEAASALQDRVPSVLLGSYLAFLIAWAMTTVGLLVTYRCVTTARPIWRACTWSAAGAGSCVAGFGLGYVVLLHLHPKAGLPFGGSEALGLAAVAALWLWWLHAVALLGYAAATAPRRRRGRRSRASDSHAGGAPASSQSHREGPR